MFRALRAPLTGAGLAGTLLARLVRRSGPAYTGRHRASGRADPRLAEVGDGRYVTVDELLSPER